MSTKVNFYNQIRANNFRTFLLFVLFFILILGLGATFGFFLGDPIFGLIITSIIGIIYGLIAFFAGDRMVLKFMGAKEASKQDYAYYVNTVEGLAIAAGIPTPKAYIIDTPALNAFATGRDPKHGAVTVTTGLLNKLNREELEGVVAHEIAHIKNYDIRTMLIASILVGIVIIISDFMLRSAIFGGLSGGSRGGGRNSGGGAAIFLIVAIILAILAPIIAYLIKLTVSRKREYVADAEGARLTRNPPALARALEKIAGDSADFKQASNAYEHMFISKPKKKSFLANMFSTHPPIEERIKLLKEM